LNSGSGSPILRFSKRLEAGEDLWLRALGNKLDKASALEVVEEAARRSGDADMRSYLYVLMRSNPGIIQEVLKMSDVADITFEEALEQAGFIAKWETRGKEEQAVKIVKNLLANGFSVEQAAKLAEMDIEKVRTLAV
jgi:SOS response regulatory protein OraA/RecX